MSATFQEYKKENGSFTIAGVEHALMNAPNIDTDPFSSDYIAYAITEAQIASNSQDRALMTWDNSDVFRNPDSIKVI